MRKLLSFSILIAFASVINAQTYNWTGFTTNTAGTAQAFTTGNMSVVVTSGGGGTRGYSYGSASQIGGVGVCAGTPNGLFLEMSGASSAWNNFINVAITFATPVCAPVTFSIYDINEAIWGGGGPDSYYDDQVSIGATDQLSAVIAPANFSFAGCAVAGNISTVGNNKVLRGRITSDGCSCSTATVTMNGGGQQIKTINILYNNVKPPTYAIYGICQFQNIVISSITAAGNITPTFAAVAPICSGAALAALPSTSTNGVTGTWSPALNNTATTLYTFTPTAGLCATTTTLTITVNPPTTPTFAVVTPKCSGSFIAALPTTSTNGITGTWSPAIDNTATTLYTFTPTAGLCATTTTMSITVNPNVTPTFTAIAPICSGAALAALPTTSTNGITGTWSPAINNTATTLYTFTPTAGLCATISTLTINVTPNTTPTFAAVAPICSGDALAALPTTSINAITGTWSPALNNTATTLYTFTPTAGLCATTTTLSITVNTPTTPTFAAVTPICSGAALAALPTTSINGITGTWSPALDNTTTTIYTFTPTAGQCAVTTTLTISVGPPAIPTFAAVAPICSGAALSALSTTSTNAITGTWSPALNNTATTLYTFTPTAGLCATTTTMSITVNPNVTPTFAAVAPICSGAALASLPTTSTNGITGTWSPAINNTATTLYTFTPTAGLCATTTTISITVTPNVTPTFAAVAPICSGAALAALPTTSINGITGTWSPALDNSTTTIYTFTPTAGQCAVTTTLTISVGPPAIPTFAAVAPICSGAALAALPTTSTNAITGTWSPAIDNTTTTLYTFMPTAGLCATTTTMSITVNPNVTPTFAAVSPICSGASLAALPTTSTNGITGTWSPAINNTATTLYTFTPTVGLCATTTTLSVTVNSQDDASFAYLSNTYCLTGVDPTPTVTGLAGGIFTISGVGVINATTGVIDLSASGLASFTVTYNTAILGNACPNSTTTNITITSAPSAAFSYDATQYCQNAVAPILTFGAGSSAGVFSSIPVGLTLDVNTGAITLPSTAGVYTVYNTVAAAGGCAIAIDSTTVEVLLLDDATFSYVTGVTYCLTGTDPVATVTGTAGGTFTISGTGVINSSTGLIDLDVSGLGTYTVYYNTPATNACPQVDSTTINIVSSPEASFTYASPFCEGGVNTLPTFVGNNFPGTFSSNPLGVVFISTSTGELDLTATPAGAYTIYNNLAASGGCAAALDSFVILINPSYNILETTSVCSGGSYTFPDGTTQNNITVLVVYNSNLTTSLGCDSIIQTTVNVNPIYFVQITDSVCLGNVYTFPDGSTQTINAQVIDTSFLQTTLSCDSVVEVTVNLKAPVASQESTSICNGGSYTFPDGTTLNNLISDTVFVSTIVASTGCDSIVTTNLTVNPVIFTQETTSVCSGGSYTFPDGTTQNNIIIQVIHNSNLTTSLGCDSIIETTINVNPILNATPNAVTPICLGDSINLTAAASGSGTITWYSDAGGTMVVGTGSPCSPTPTVASTGVYTYYVNEVGACSSILTSINVIVGGVTAVIGATPSSGMVPLTVVFSNGSTTGPSIIYTWNFGAGTALSNQFQPSYIYTGLGVYTASLIVTDGVCSDTASILIEVKTKSSILIPNVFTPNGDGHNDVFTVIGENLESVEGQIFNRWGQKLFAWNGLKGFWNGRTLAGEECPDGTYFYIISAKGVDGEKYFKTGAFTLIR